MNRQRHLSVPAKTPFPLQLNSEKLKPIFFSKSPKNPSTRRDQASPCKSNIKKMVSHKLFKGAHKVQGETFLQMTPQSTILSTKKSSIGTASNSPTLIQLSRLRANSKIKKVARLKISRVFDIAINSKESDLSQLIFGGQMPEEEYPRFFGNISTVKEFEEKGELPLKCSLSDLVDIIKTSKK